MNFFSQLSGIIPEGVDLNMTVRRSGIKLIVSIMPKVNDLKDDAKNRLTPLVITGTTDELNEGFFEAISNPVKHASSLLTNMSEFEKATKEAEANSKAAKDKADAEKKKSEEKKKNLDKYLKQATEEENSKEYRKAIISLQKAKEYSENPKDIDSRISKLQGKLNENSLFSSLEPNDEPTNEKILIAEAEMGTENITDEDFPSQDEEIAEVDFEDNEQED